MARCHRIGQTKAVRVFRLVTRGTCEEAILQTASRKHGLDEALLGGSAAAISGETEQLADVARIEGLLQHGVMAFSEQAAAEGVRFCAEGIDDILRNRVERRQMGSRKGNTFSIATFVAEEMPPDKLDPRTEAGLSVAQPERADGQSSYAFWTRALPGAGLPAQPSAAALKLSKQLDIGQQGRKSAIDPTDRHASRAAARAQRNLVRHPTMRWTTAAAHSRLCAHLEGDACTTRRAAYHQEEGAASSSEAGCPGTPTASGCRPRSPIRRPAHALPAAACAPANWRPAPAC